MWPYKLMPNPLGGKRLLDYDITVTYQKSKLIRPIRNLQGYPKNRANTGEQEDSEIKTQESRIWIVNIKIPRKLMTNIERGYAEFAGEKIDFEDIEEAENSNLEQAATAPEMSQDLAPGPI